MKTIQIYETADVKVTFDPRICTHSGNCVRGLPAVFDLKRKPWVKADGASAQEIREQIAKCPSAALKFEQK